jgi:hypothetical protein
VTAGTADAVYAAVLASHGRPTSRVRPCLKQPASLLLLLLLPAHPPQGSCQCHRASASTSAPTLLAGSFNPTHARYPILYQYARRDCRCCWCCVCCHPCWSWQAYIKGPPFPISQHVCCCCCCQHTGGYTPQGSCRCHRASASTQAPAPTLLAGSSAATHNTHFYKPPTHEALILLSLHVGQKVRQLLLLPLLPMHTSGQLPVPPRISVHSGPSSDSACRK